MDKNQVDIQTWIGEADFLKYSLSSPKDKKGELRSIKLQKNNQKFTAEIKYQKHNNIVNFDSHEKVNKFTKENFSKFKQALVQFKSKELQILFNKKDQAKVLTKNITVKNKAHNRTKNYLIPDGKPCPFFFEIGVMNAQGKVKSDQYKKFKQINRFLEMVDDSFKDWDKDEITVVDFGCGKSYLTFALYHYFTEIKKIDAHITGLDLKQDVIKDCQNIADKIGYTGLKFKTGFVRDYENRSEIDFIVTLHACDTATDDAILFAIKNKAKRMFFVPCCQHELNKQLQNIKQDPMLKYGIIKDRLTALVTDSMRTQLLEVFGYKVQCLEFIESEHTAKNILLRCQRVERSKTHTEELKDKYLTFKSEWNISPYLEKELRKMSDNL